MHPPPQHRIISISISLYPYPYLYIYIYISISTHAYTSSCFGMHMFVTFSFCRPPKTRAAPLSSSLRGRWWTRSRTPAAGPAASGAASTSTPTTGPGPRRGPAADGLRGQPKKGPKELCCMLPRDVRTEQRICQLMGFSLNRSDLDV